MNGYNTSYDLSRIKGTSVRRQYFNNFLRAVLSFFSFYYFVLIAYYIKEGEINDSQVLTFIKGSVVFIIILAFLSVINRFYFGKTLCVVNKGGIYTERIFIPWDRIVSISYIPVPWELSSKRHNRKYENFTRLYIVARNAEGKEYGWTVLFFPLYGLKIIKSYAPNISTAVDKGGRNEVLFYTFSELIAGLALGLYILFS